MLNILHDKLLRLGKFGWCERVGLANDWDNIDAGGKPLHQFNVKLS